MTRETLDETVDRVAAALTIVPADPSFSERLRPKLDGQSRLTWMAVATSAAVAAIAIGTTLGVREQASMPVNRPIAAAVQTPAAWIAAPSVPSPRVGTAVHITRAERAGGAIGVAAGVAHAQHGSDESTAAIPALAGPDELAVDHLILAPLVIEPVALESLEMDTIAVSGIGGDPKE